MAAILSEYPQEVVDFVCDPRTGLPRTLKWLPTIAEIAEACDVRVELAKRVAVLRDGVSARRAVLVHPEATDEAKWIAQRWLDDRSVMIGRYGL